MKPNCDCVAGFNEALIKYNTKLDLCLFIDGGATPQISTVKLDKKNRQKPRTVLPSFCPFCGIKYDDGKKENTNDTTK